MNKNLTALLLAALFGSAQALTPPSAPERVSRALATASENLVKSTEDGRTVWRLYGRVINDSSTEFGRLACARVASIILNKAGVGVSITDGVGELEGRLRHKGWRKVENMGELERGDVVVWRKRFADDVCTGGGDCHVGIYMGGGFAYDNDGKLGYPIPYPVAPRIAFAFKTGYRPR